MWWGIALGALVTMPALLLAIMSGGGGHGNYGLARALYPVPMILAELLGSIGAVPIALAVVQWPLIGGLLGWAIPRRRWGTLAAVIGLYWVALAVCFSGSLRNFA